MRHFSGYLEHIVTTAAILLTDVTFLQLLGVSILF
jgi:hypothetical protein